MRQPPPRDSAGLVTPHDHAEVQNDHRVIRRVSEEQIVTRADGRRTLSTKCFKPSSDKSAGLSVDLEGWLVEDGIDPAGYVTNPKYMGSVVFPVEAARVLGCQVGWDPIEADVRTEANPYHGEVWGVGRNNKARQRAIQNASDWLVPFEGVYVQ